MSRTNNVIRNIKFALISQVINLLLSFISRTIFIYFLGTDYLGVNGLFSNILTMLSFAELGFGNAIVYNLYKPLAKKDTEKIKSLVNLYKNIYVKIGVIVLCLGIVIIPFLDVFIKGKPDIKESIYFIYLLFLCNSSISYFFVYKITIITADQKNYIVISHQQAIQLLQCVLQIIFLYLTHNYIIYLLIQIGCSVSMNVWLSKKAERLYPYLKDKEVQSLKKEEKKELFTNVKALAVYKFASTILNGTDNILVSALVGIKEVGLYSNYVLVINAFINILNKVTDSFTASIGNLNAIESVERKRQIFNEVFMICSWLFGFVSLGLLLLFNDFITIWIGCKYIMSSLVVFSIVLHFYINGVHYIAYTYRTTLGLFVQGWIAPLLAAILNLVLSFLLYQYIGLAGIFFATSIARFFTTGIVDPYLIYKKVFQDHPLKYYIMYFKFIIIYIGIFFLLSSVLKYISIFGILGFVVKIIVVSIVFNGLMVIIFWHDKTFQGLFQIVRDKIGKKI